MIFIAGMLILAVVGITGCNNTQAKEPTAQPLPVQTKTVNLAAVPRVDEYVATVKSRRAATIQPQVDGTLTRILVKSGDHVRAGQLLMTIDPLKQQATVDQQHSTEAQKKALLDFNHNEVERQRRLFESGVTSKRDYESAVQAYENSKADWEASTAARVTQQRELAYYNLTAPFAGVVRRSVAWAYAAPGRTSAATTVTRAAATLTRPRLTRWPVLALPLPCRSMSTAVRTVTSSR